MAGLEANQDLQTARDLCEKAWQSGYAAGQDKGLREKEVQEAVEEAYNDGFDQGYRDALRF